MPNFNLIQPLVETIDRRGANFVQGLGNANTSQLGSFLEGFTEGATDITNIRTSQLRAQVEFDPKKILADQVKRELQNQELEEAIKSARITNEFLPENLRTTIDARKASTSSIIQRTRESSRTEDFNVRKAEIALQKGERDAIFDEEFGLEKRLLELQKLERSAKGTSNRTGSQILGDESKFQKLPQVQDLQDDIEEGSLPDAGQEAQEKGRLAGLELERMRKTFDLLPSSGEVSERPTEQEFREQTLNDKISNIQNIAKESEDSSLNASIERARVRFENLRDENRKIEASSKIYRKTSENLRQSNEDNNPLPKLNDIGLLAETARQLPDTDSGREQKAIIRDKLRAELKDPTLGLKQIRESIEDDTASPEVSKGYEEILAGAAVVAEDPSLLTSRQRDLFGVLTQNPNASDESIIEALSNPEVVENDLATILTGSTANVETDIIKGLRTNPYVIAARKASNNGTTGYSIQGEYTETPSTGVDVADGGGQTITGIQFVSADGTAQPVLGAPEIGSPDDGLVNALERVGSNLSQAGQKVASTESQVSGIEQRQQAITQPLSREQINTQVATEFNTGVNRAKLAGAAGFTTSTARDMSQDTRDSLNNLLRSVEDGRFDDSLTARGLELVGLSKADQREFNQYVDNSVDDLWRIVTPEQKELLKTNRIRTEEIIRGQADPSQFDFSDAALKEEFKVRARPEIERSVKQQIEQLAGDAAQSRASLNKQRRLTQLSNEKAVESNKNPLQKTFLRLQTRE